VGRKQKGMRIEVGSEEPVVGLCAENVVEDGVVAVVEVDTWMGCTVSLSVMCLCVCVCVWPRIVGVGCFSIH
jgi:hypothetical protein